ARIRLKVHLPALVGRPLAVEQRVRIRALEQRDRVGVLAAEQKFIRLVDQVDGVRGGGRLVPDTLEPLALPRVDIAPGALRPCANRADHADIHDDVTYTVARLVKSLGLGIRRVDRLVEKRY